MILQEGFWLGAAVGLIRVEEGLGRQRGLNLVTGARDVRRCSYLSPAAASLTWIQLYSPQTSCGAALGGKDASDAGRHQESVFG